MKKYSPKQRNYVAKHAAKFQSSKVFKDKKKAAKSGEQKHKEVYKKYVPAKSSDYVPPQVYRREGTANIPSRVTAVAIGTPRKESTKYTGDKLVGIATMHKSNMVPVFKRQDAIDIAQMRRA